MKLRIALEWFVNPDHLPFIAGILSGAYQKAGLEVEIIEPKEHYDGFEDLKQGNIDMHVNEPLHLFEHHFDELRSLGCFFETEGGVMIRSTSVDKLHNNEPIRITTPAANEVTNKIGFEILKRYANQEGFELDKENVEFVETDFYHIKNMQEGDYDGAWLCFYNFEAIEAEYKKFEHIFISQFVSPYPNFSALEIMTTKSVMDAKYEAITKFIDITNAMVEYVQKEPIMAKQLYYDYSKEEPSELMDRIIANTLPRFETSIQASSTKWQKLYEFLEELEIVKLSPEAYNRIWLKKKE
ncbi:MAG: ABC transporter substrate-binding protein [Campylobacterales bacterium]|nr:ABC transporter substrate-binding protein [Campylobacterales bacterium]